MDLSIVIPVFNEASKIRQDIDSAAIFLVTEKLKGEIIIVDDGSHDHTAQMANDTEVPKGVIKQVISLEINKGKGFAVRMGILKSKGTYVMFADSGNCVPYKNILPAINFLKEDKCDIAHGSRRLAESKIKRASNKYRQILSRLFRWAMSIFMGVPSNLTDTQCGFKIYKGDVARELYRKSQINGFSFDIEIILLAIKNRYRMIEFPVEWKSDLDSRVLPHRIAFGIWQEFIMIKKTQLINAKKKRCLAQRKILNKKRSYCIYLFWILVIIAGIKLVTIGLYPLMDKTEARYAEIAREMIVTNNWITPQLDDGYPFWGKPPLSFWLTAWGMLVFGINEFGARISSWGLALITAYFTFLVGAKFRGKIFGLISVLILWSTVLFFVLSGAVMTDPTLVMTITMALGSFFLTFRAQSKLKKRIFSYLFFVGIGLSLLAKGPVGVILIGMPIFLWTLWHKQWKEVWRNFEWIRGIILTLSISVPWYLLAESQTPGFLNYFIIGEHWQRFTMPGWQGDLYGSGHAYPKGTIWLFSIPAMMPWSIFLVFILGLRLKNKQKILSPILKDKWLSYFLFWMLSPMFLFTAASNISFHYVAPALPAFSLFMALSLKGYKNNMVKVICVVFVPMTVLIASLTFLPIIGKNNSQISIIKMFKDTAQNEKSELIYLGSMPHSAEFYMNGKVRKIEKNAVEILLKELSDRNEDFFVVKQDETSWMPKGFFELTKEVGRHKEYILRKEFNFLLNK